MNTKTDKVTQSALALSLTSSNPSEYPLIYSDDSWCLVETGTSLATIMEQTGTATQSEINEKLAKNAGAGAGVVEQVTKNTAAIKGIIDTSLKNIDGCLGALDPCLFTSYGKNIVNDVSTNAAAIAKLRTDVSNSYYTKTNVDTSLKNYVLTSTYSTKMQALDASIGYLNTSVGSLWTMANDASKYINDISVGLSSTSTRISELNASIARNYYTITDIDKQFTDVSAYNNNTYLKKNDFTSWQVNTYTPFVERIDGSLRTAFSGISTNSQNFENVSSNLNTVKTTLSTAINDVSTLAEQNETSINGIISGTIPAWGTLTKVQINWIKKKMQEELSEEALKLYSIGTSGGATFYSDETAAASMTSTVTVTLTYNGTSQVKADTTPSGWTQNTPSTDKYTYTKTATTSASVPATTFKYTVPSSDPSYGGITVSKNSTAKSVSVVNPAYYGIVNSKSTSTISTFIKNLTRITTRLSTTASITNTTGSAGYLVIVTKSTATATQLGLSILDAATSGISFTSPKNSAITMSGYNVYFSTNSVASGGSLENTLLTINL
jgi:hypothetical protein